MQIVGLVLERLKAVGMVLSRPGDVVLDMPHHQAVVLVIRHYKVKSKEWSGIGGGKQ